MASGTVTYRSDKLYPGKEISFGANAQSWNMEIVAGNFPKESVSYKLNKVTLRIDIAEAYGPDRHMIVSRETGEQLGDVATVKTGVQELDLLTSSGYRDIKSIITDGDQNPACRLRADSYIYIIIDWEETSPEENKNKKKKQPVVVTGTELTGKAGTVLHTKVAVSFDGVDISDPINENLITMGFTDNEEDEADDLQIKLEDHAKKWLGAWLNDTMIAASYGVKKKTGKKNKNKSKTKGLTISAGVKQYRPDGKITKADFGFFELDEIRASGPPSTVIIKGTSLTFSNGIRTEERDKSWENYTLKGIVAEIAKKAGLDFLYDCPKNPKYELVEQASQTDIAFLQQLCHDNGFSLKIYGYKLIIFDQSKYENVQEYMTIKFMDGSYTKYDLQTQDGDTHYDECVVKYYDAKAGKTYEGSAKAEDYDEDASEHTVCTITNRKVKSNDAAANLASKLLRLHNKYEKKCSFTMLGNPMLGAGLTIRIKGFGLWDDKYIIKQAKHDISSSGYTTKLTLRTIPEGTVTTTKNSSGGGSGGGKNRKGDYAYYTTCTVKVFNASTGDDGSAWIAKDVEVKFCGKSGTGRTLVSYGSILGYVNTSCLERRKKTDKKTDNK